MRFRPKGGSIAAFKSCFAYVRRTYAGALPAELKVHIDFEEVTLRHALHNLTGAPDSFGIHCCSVRRTGAMGHSNHSLNGPEGRIQVLYQLGKFCEARALSTPSKPNKVTAACLASACMSSRTILGQALGLLVPVSSIHYCTSTSGLSTSSSTTCLTP